jgi:hypothetical protein
MVSKVKIIAIGLIATVITAVAAASIPEIAQAYSLVEGVNAARGENQPTDLFGAGGIFTTVVNVLLFIVGVLSVIMLIIGGLRYVLSGGNATAVSNAKNTILYALVGLVIAFLAFAAVNFVLDMLAPGGTSGGTDI